MDIERLWKEYRYRLLHYLRDHSRWNRRRPPVVAFPELATECPDTGTQTQETRLEVRNFLGMFSDGDREIAFLRYAEDLPLTEIARVVGKPVGTVKYRLHEIRFRFRSLWEASRA